MGLRVGFMGTPDFAVEALGALIESDHEIVCVYSQPARPKGRGHQVQPSPVHALAEAKGIPVFTPTELKSAEEQARFAAHNLDVAIVAAYGLILPEAILNAPKYGCLNIHASLLPRWRGASPIQQAIRAGDAETGVTIMQMDKGLDTGPMIAKDSMPITQETTASSLHDELAALGARMTLTVLDRLARDGALPAEPQNDEDYTYAPLLTKEDGIVNWEQNALWIDRQIRALNPWPGVWSRFGGTRIKIIKAHVEPESVTDPTWSAPGTVLSTNGQVFCGEGSILRLELVQPEGKKAMDFASAVNGGYITAQERFS
ncbi:MAG: methionyl-tRNA formyltransferase [Alphaproteobacteria bacterium]|nr:methionyl-tRNA formyltransferase [Alphaproteobacteria bacterium]